MATDGPRLLVMRTADWSVARRLFGLPTDQFHNASGAWHRDCHYVYAAAAGACVCVYHVGRWGRVGGMGVAMVGSRRGQIEWGQGPPQHSTAQRLDGVVLDMPTGPPSRAPLIDVDHTPGLRIYMSRSAEQHSTPPPTPCPRHLSCISPTLTVMCTLPCRQICLSCHNQRLPDAFFWTTHVPDAGGWWSWCCCWCCSRCGAGHSARIVATLQGMHKVNVRGLDYDPARNVLATCSFDKSVKLLGASAV